MDTLHNQEKPIILPKYLLDCVTETFEPLYKLAYPSLVGGHIVKIADNLTQLEMHGSIYIEPEKWTYSEPLDYDPAPILFKTKDGYECTLNDATLAYLDYEVYNTIELLKDLTIDYVSRDFSRVFRGKSRIKFSPSMIEQINKRLPKPIENMWQCAQSTDMYQDLYASLQATKAIYSGSFTPKLLCMHADYLIETARYWGFIRKEQPKKIKR